MVQLADGDIKTREVLGWKGVHVLHFSGSSCSQKLRVFLNLKNIPWHSHPVDLPSNENFRPWFLGINPRGLVPVLVHDGAVHIESNDIITYLEKTFPAPKLVPAGHENKVAALLKHEDDLHLDLRTLSFRFVFAPPGPPKPAAALESYIANGTGTVRGVKDHEKQIQIEFWQRAAKEGFTDERARASALRFRTEFDTLDKTLARQPYLLGENLSVLDIAWLIYENRLSLAGYPFARLHLPYPCLGRQAPRHAGICQGDRAASPFAGTARRRPPRASGQDAGSGRGILAWTGIDGANVERSHA